MSIPKITLSGNHNEEFYKVLRQRVNTYFKSNNISKYANGKMIFKTVCMFMLFLIPLTLLLTVKGNMWFEISMWLMMGVGMAGLGLSVMHDANHGSYSRNEKINRWCLENAV